MRFLIFRDFVVGIVTETTVDKISLAFMFGLVVLFPGFQRISVFELRWVFLKTGSGEYFSNNACLAGILYHPNRSLFKNTSVHGRF